MHHPPCIGRREQVPERGVAHRRPWRHSRQLPPRLFQQPVIDADIGQRLASFLVPPLGGQPTRRFRHPAADDERQDRGQNADREQPTPTEMRHQQQRHTGGCEIAHRPAQRQHRGDPAADARGRVFGHQSLVDRHHAAEAEPGQKSRANQKAQRSGQTGQSRECREHQHGRGEYDAPSPLVGDPAPAPRSDAHPRQCRRANEADLRWRQRELLADFRQRIADDGDVEGIEQKPRGGDGDDEFKRVIQWGVIDRAPDDFGRQWRG